ncbi:MAG: 30S ribosomal protein S19e [Methanomassiliicoccales archaeon]
MTTAYDVPASELVEALAERLKKIEAIREEDWLSFVKTGRHREKAPASPGWWHRRVASVLRKVYILGPVGTSRLAAEFGGSADRGSKPNKAVSGSGSITRLALQQLEMAKLVTRQKNKGRIVTSEGRKFVDNTAHEIFLQLMQSNPELGKYRLKVESEV